MTRRGGLALERVLELADSVPSFDRFPHVDGLIAEFVELAAQMPDVVRRRRIGSSRAGDAIEVVQVGNGPHQAVVIAGVHPNEPIGGLTALHLARSMAMDAQLRRDLGYTWNIVSCIDPDGMRLNEGWFDRPLTRSELGRRFYRPPFDEQVAWTFPLDYKTRYFDRALPETHAAMRLIDATTPAFLCGLHNGEIGGAYYYLSEEAADVYPTLQALPAHFGIPLDLGEPEMAFCPQYATAIFGDVKIADQYEFAESMGLDPTVGIDAGSSINDYASQYDTFCLTSEVPYWSPPEIADETPTSTPYRNVLEAAAADLGSLSHSLGATLEHVRADLTINTPFLRAVSPSVAAIAAQARELRERATRVRAERLATVAETSSSAHLVHSLRMRFGGMTLRLLESETNAGTATAVVRKELKEVELLYQGWARSADADTPHTPLSIRSLVGVQYGAILAAASHANPDRRERARTAR